MALPGLAASESATADDLQYTFDYQHYSEGERDLNGRSYSNLNLKPLSVDSFSLDVNGGVTDRLSLGFDYSQDTWSGATPVTTVPQPAIGEQVFSGASQPTYFYADASHHPVDVNWDSFDGTSVEYARDRRLVHVMASASPETRREVALKFGYTLNNSAAVSIGGGFSDEPDYRSAFLNAGGRIDFDNALTTVSWSASYTHSDINASLAANDAADWGYYASHIHYEEGTPVLSEQRQDVNFDFGVTRVLDKNSLLSGTVSFAQSWGYLSNPYKATVLAFDDPNQFIDSTGLRFVMIKGTLEQRPTQRNQLAATLNYVHYFEPFDASLHVSYRYYHDNWSINAHTLDVSWFQPFGDGWMIVPGVRYYSQSAAWFYQPYFYFNQAFPFLLPRNPELPPQLDHSQITVKHFSSDERLSAFGELSGRVALSKQLTDAITLETGVEFSRHAGSLRFGGHGEGSYADFNYRTVYAQLTLNPQPEGDSAFSGAGLGLTANADGHVPAGVDYERPLVGGQYAASYRYGLDVYGGGFQHGADGAPDARVENQACGEQNVCEFLESGIGTHVQALDLLYAPSDWLTLEVQPHLVDSHVDQRLVNFIFHPFLGFPKPDETRTHTMGGLGDTTVAAVVPLFDSDAERIDASFGVSVPTGSVNVRRAGTNQYLDYAQQLGSGTWDFEPALTYNGSRDPLFWGAQASASLRLEDRNNAGYALGNVYRATGWAGVEVFDWLSATIRGAYSDAEGLSGEFGLTSKTRSSVIVWSVTSPFRSTARFPDPNRCSHRWNRRRITGEECGARGWVSVRSFPEGCWPAIG